MVGITRFGAYVPYYRLGVGTEAWKGRGERANREHRRTLFRIDDVSVQGEAGCNPGGQSDRPAQ